MVQEKEDMGNAMIVKRAAVLLAASALAGCTAVKTALSPLGEIIGPDSMAEQYVSVRTVPLYSEPSGFSAVVTNVEYSSQVRVLQYVSKVPAVFVEQPVSSNSIPRWVEVEFAGMTGYVPERVLVDKNQMRDQGNGEDGSVVLRHGQVLQNRRRRIPKRYGIIHSTCSARLNRA